MIIQGYARKTWRIIFISLFIGIFLFICKPLRAEDAVKGSETVKNKELVGKVVYFTPRNEPRVIGVACDPENTDYSFTIDKDTKVSKKRSLKEIKVGDTVRVKYQETIRKGNGRRASRRVAKVIGFVRAGDKKGALQA